MMIDEPINQAERDFHLSVCVERIHRDILEPIAIAHRLTLVDTWGTAQVVEAADLDEFLVQMRSLMDHIARLEDQSEDCKKFLGKRMQDLVNETTRWIRSRPGLAVWIG